jgi:hypothetical protein
VFGAFLAGKPRQCWSYAIFRSVSTRKYRARPEVCRIGPSSLSDLRNRSENKVSEKANLQVMPELKMSWARADFLDFQANDCSIGDGKRGNMHRPDHFAADFP